MIERLLPTKLAMPRPSRWRIHRPRLASLLDGSLDARLVLLSAPPGFGKTTALVDWLDGSPVRSAWIALDATDNDAVRFLRYLGAAVASLVGQEARGDVLLPVASGDVLAVVEELAAWLAARPEPMVLGLDDYHLITDATVEEAVAALVERLPPQAHVAISTRADPALPLARLRARGELLEVRADALRFTNDEASAFFLERIGPVLGPADVDALVARTEGWPAVLQLVSATLAGRTDVAARVRDFTATHRFVLDYVVEEVLANLPPETEGFLLRTSILERLCGSLCDAVTGVPEGRERLEALERANLLVIPLDEERRWYRYHALFAEVLRARLRVRDPGEVSTLHARASAWHMAHEHDDEAIAHALASGDLQASSAIIADASLRRLNAGEISTVRAWLDALPPQAVRGHAQLSASYAWCLALSGETGGIAERLADAERANAADDAADPTMAAIIRTQVALLRSRLADLEGDSATAIAQARLARELVPTGLPAEAEATLRGDATILLARGLLIAGDRDAAAHTYEAALPDLRAGGNAFAAGRAIADLAAIELARGDPAAALRICESEVARAPADSAATASAAVWAAMARAGAELGRLELAESAARHGLELAVRSGDAQSVRSIRTTLARLEQLRSNAASGDGPRQRRRGHVAPEVLSERELEVLRLVALGRSNSQIGTELFVTVGTVKSHLHTISGKLGAANRVEAVARGRELGLLG